MNLYLDDNADEQTLATLLRKAHHQVTWPAEAGTLRALDAVHLEYAARTGLILITYDREDFRALHQLVLTTHGIHPGILIVRFDNDRHRDMQPKDIATAIGKLERAGFEMANQFVILNQWR
jgi:predicted nuclease of predicted toxin-antitoxin system